MKVRTLQAAALAAGLASLLVSVAQAQTGRGAAAPPPSQAPLAEGPPIANLCVWRPQEITAASKVGQVVLTRLKVLGSQINAELQPERDGINTEAKTLQTQQASMDQATLQARAANLDLRKNTYVKKAQLRQQQLEATQAVQLDTIRKQMAPIVRDLYQQHHCSILFDYDSGSITQASPAMDLSREAQAALDVKIQSLTFDLMTPEQLSAFAASQQQQR